MAFNAGDNVDCSRWTRARMEREPEEGERREGGAAARKKRRQRRKRTTTSDLKVEDQPWILNVNNKGKAGKKKFKGQKKLGVMGNASYYVFRRRDDDGSFDAFPVRGGWYAFTPQAKHRTLTDEEAEAEWARRNKVLNHFSIMLQRRLSDRCGEEEEEEGEKGGKRKNCGGGDLRIIDPEEEEEEDPGMSSDDSDDSSMGGDGEGKSKVKKGKDGRKRRKEKKERSDLDKAVEDSDDGDCEGLEVEYMSDESSSSEEVEEEEGPNKPDKGEQLPKGIDEASESEEESEEEEEEEEKGRKTPVQLGEKTKEKNSSGESDSSDDSDIEEAASALFMAPSKRTAAGGDRGGSRLPGTPPRSIDSASTACSTLRGFAASQSEQQGKKRQPPSGASTDTPAAKRLRMEPDNNSQGPAASSGSSGGMQSTVALQLPASGEPTPATGVTGDLLQLTEEAVRRYLLRKPMTTRDLLRQFNTKRTGMSGTQTVNVLAHVLKRLAPQRRNVNGTMHFYLTE